MKFSIKIHPLFICIGILYTIMGSGFIFLCYFLSVIIHEMAHARFARLRGYRLNNIVLMPYGAVLKGGENFGKLDSILIAIAGPMCNLVIALFIVALWWLFPASYSATESLMWANLSLALFNLLPIFPLDGARVILAYSKRKALTLRRLRIVGIIIGAIFMVLMIISLFYQFNISLGIMGLFMVHGAISGTDKEMYAHIMSMNNFTKSTIDAISYLDIGISKDALLYKFLECVRKDSIVTFHVLDNDVNEVEVLSEEEVKDILLSNELSTPFSKAIRPL